MAAVPQRRTACFTINPTLIDDLTPHDAGWYAGEDPWTAPPSAGGPPTCGDRSGALARMPGEAGQPFEERGVAVLGSGESSVYRHASGRISR
jgi:hypothetical protein